jgi:hypothetical protein
MLGLGTQIPIPIATPSKTSEGKSLAEKKSVDPEEGIAPPDNEPVTFENGRHPFFTVDPSEATGHFQSLTNPPTRSPRTGERRREGTWPHWTPPMQPKRSMTSEGKPCSYPSHPRPSRSSPS